MKNCSLNFLTSPNKVCGFGKYSSFLIDELKKYCDVIPVYVIPNSNPFYYIKKAKECSKILIHIQFEYSFFWNSSKILGIYAFLFFPILYRKHRIVTTLHEITIQSLHNIILLKIIAYCSKRLIVHTEEAKERLLKAGIKPNKIFIIPLGVLYTPTFLNKEDVKRDLGFNTNEKIVLFFGFLNPMKGIEDLIDAMVGIDATLVIAGDLHPSNKEKGKLYLEELHSRISQREINAKFLGYIDNKDIPLIMNSADLIVLPYKNNLQSGVFNLVSSYRIPCISSNIRSFSDINRKYQYPYIFSNLHEDIKKLLSDSKLNEQLKNAANKYNTDNSIDKVIQDTLNVYGYVMND